MSSGAADAVTALQAAAKAAFQAAFDAGSAFGRSHSAVRQASDVVDVMRAVVGLITAAESLHDQAESAVRELRATLAAQLLETGAVKIQTDHHVAYLSKRPAFVSVDQEDLIPAEFTTTKTVVDKRAIASAIKDGIEVAGASLVTPNEMTLTIRVREAKS